MGTNDDLSAVPPAIPMPPTAPEGANTPVVAIAAIVTAAMIAGEVSVVFDYPQV